MHACKDIIGLLALNSSFIVSNNGSARTIIRIDMYNARKNDDTSRWNMKDYIGTGNVHFTQ